MTGIFIIYWSLSTPVVLRGLPRQNRAVRIQLLSDLHLEVDPSFQAVAADGADVLVLAGDIGSHAPRSRLGAVKRAPAGTAAAPAGLQLDDGRPARFGLERFSPRLGWPTPVLYVPGNHEYDGLELHATRAHLRAVCDELGIVWLDREVAYFDRRRRSWLHGPPSQAAQSQSVRVLGTTLWADFDALGPRHDSPSALAQQLEARRKAFSAANWYLNTVGSSVQQDGGSERPFDAAQLREFGLQSQAWLRAALGQTFAGTTVVVTHFAPSLRSADPRYGLTPGTAGFCNALDDWLEQADLWLHGHLHCPSDYRAGRCRVVANPLGYAKKGEQIRFEPAQVLEI